MAHDTLDLLDWKRRIFELYAEIRRTPDPKTAWQRWRLVRDELFGSHPQTPLPPKRRAGFAGVDYYAYDPAARVHAEVVPAEADPIEIVGTAGSTVTARRFAFARFELMGEQWALELYWLQGYGGGVFLPFGDTTNGHETYGSGRYLLDSVKGADLGMAGERMVLDFNFAYNPSCSYDPRWACPLTPPENRLPIEIAAGERTL
jgi:uncharacterized protein (DUF1684 family)